MPIQQHNIKVAVINDTNENLTHEFNNQRLSLITVNREPTAAMNIDVEPETK